MLSAARSPREADIRRPRSGAQSRVRRATAKGLRPIRAAGRNASLKGSQGATSRRRRPSALVIPFPPGGSTDIIGRIAADGMAKVLGQPIVIDNRGGAAGAIGAKAIADATPDGYTIGVATVSTHVVNPVVKSDLRYDV